MTLKELMTSPVVSIAPEESVAVAARTLARSNVGALPVCSRDGKLRGMLTDRDIVTRCLAANRKAESTRVEEIMTAQIVSAAADMEAAAAADLMGSRQIRRLPVVEGDRLCGMVSLADLAVKSENSSAADALRGISSGLSSRE